MPLGSYEKHYCRSCAQALAGASNPPMLALIRSVVAQAVRERASAIKFGVRTDRCFAQYHIGDQWVDRQYGPLKLARFIPLGVQDASGRANAGAGTSTQILQMTLRDSTVTVMATVTAGSPEFELALEY